MRAVVLIPNYKVRPTSLGSIKCCCLYSKVSLHSTFHLFSHRANINNLNSIESDEVQSLILAMLTCQDMPTHVLEQIAKLVLERVLSSDSPQTEMRPFLSALHQRHPVILNSISEKMTQDDDSAQSSMRQLLVSLFFVSHSAVITYCIA